MSAADRLVPVPLDVRDADGPPFEVASASVSGPSADLAAELIGARTGTTPAVGPAARIRLALHAGGPPESYRLSVDADGIALTGADEAGLQHGLHTLVQLLERTGEGWRVPAVSIADAPRFAYRGVMLDVARHFHPVDVVCGYIDRAAALKFNHLHLHLTDDQGWRLELHSRPELTRVAAGSAVGGDAGGFYTQDDYRAILAHAARRHVTVVPEFDTPGHTHAAALAYPEIGKDPVLSPHIEEIAEQFGGGLPVRGEPYTGMAVGFSSLRADDAAADAFLRDVFEELAGLTPGPYLHFGGDEALGTPADEYGRLVARTSAIIAATGKTPIAWHEAGAVADLAPGTIGQYWGFVRPTEGMDEKAAGFVARGGSVILSPADAAYLDMKPDDASALGLTWANGPTSLRRAYDWEPRETLSALGESDILGVEAPMFAETARTAADIDALAYPRIAAVAEIAWSPAPGAARRTWESFRVRVGALGRLWDDAGIAWSRPPELDAD